MQGRLSEEPDIKRPKGEPPMKKIYIIIPALEPGPGLEKQIEALRIMIPSQIVVIDDGSGAAYRERFDRIAQRKGCVVLSHTVNRGKGQALKTGFRYVREKEGIRSMVLCTDCDGQHLPADGVRLLRAAGQHPGALVLGTREFNRPGVPWKSRIGNSISSLAFRLAGGISLNDTQTGFRAFDGSLLDLMIQIPGDRFEYETRVLLVCAGQGIPVLSEKIETIYVNENEGTHFRPFRDSLIVMGVLFRELGRFGLTSALCALLDLGLFGFFDSVFYVMKPFRRIAVATVMARVLSAVANFVLNYGWTFCDEVLPTAVLGGSKQKPQVQKAVLRYTMLCIGITAASAVSVYTVSLLFHIRPEGAKILCDGVLFFISYRIQRKWVFMYRRKGGSSYAG